jgi:hypothetical protein
LLAARKRARRSVTSARESRYAARAVRNGSTADCSSRTSLNVKTPVAAARTPAAHAARRPYHVSVAAKIRPRAAAPRTIWTIFAASSEDPERRNTTARK